MHCFDIFVIHIIIRNIIRKSLEDKEERHVNHFMDINYNNQ